MEKDFHYYLIYAITKITGYEEADIIASSSQFVDDNNEGQFTIDDQPSGFPEKISANGGYYYPIMTQSLSPKSLDTYVQKYVYVPFHFIPGGASLIIRSRRGRIFRPRECDFSPELYMFLTYFILTTTFRCV